MSSLSTQPLTTESRPDGNDPEKRLRYDPLKAWNGSTTSVHEERTTAQPTFAGYKWLIEHASDKNQAVSTLNSGIPTYNTSINWLTYPAKSGSPMPTENLLLEWAKRQGMKTGVVSDMPFSHPTNTILAGARSEDADDSLERFDQILKSPYLDLYVATGHPKYNELGQALSKPEYIFCSKGDWRDLRSRGRNTGWDVIYGDDNLLGVNTQAVRESDKRLVIMQFGDTTSSAGLNTDISGLSSNLSTSMRFQLKVALSYLDRSTDGFMLFIHFGRLPYLLEADLQKEALNEVNNTFKALKVCEDWVDDHGGWDKTSLILTSPYEYGLIWGPDSSTFPYSQISDRGKKRLPGFRVNHQGSTGMLTPLIIRGELAPKISDYTEGEDPVYGSYIHLENLNHLLRSFEHSRQSKIELP